MKKLCSVTVALIGLALSGSLACAQEGDKPVIKVATVIGVQPGSTTKFLLRGQKFDDAKEVRCSDGKSTAKIIGQGGADNLNMQDAKRVGDKKIEIELIVPADAPLGELGLVVVTGKGESAAHPIYVGGEFPIVEDKEPNDGFRQAQAIAVPQIVHGTIHGERNVDVFSIDGQAGQKIACEVFAARRGANLDPLLTIYNERGALIASNDDHGDSADAKLEVTLPSAGKYFIVLQDAFDLGGQAHPYRLVIK